MQQKCLGQLVRWVSVGFLSLAASALIAPSYAAGYAYVNAAVYMRAGPRIGFPILTTVYPGSGVYVHGCLSDYAWCDVSFSGERGWIDAAYLDYPYDNEFLPIVNYGPYLGIAIFSFNIGGYWRQHYFHRLWYRDRDRFRARFGLNARRGLAMRHRQFQQPRNWRQHQRQQNFRNRQEPSRRFRAPDRRDRSASRQLRFKQDSRMRRKNTRQDRRQERVDTKTRSMQQQR